MPEIFSPILKRSLSLSLSEENSVVPYMPLKKASKTTGFRDIGPRRYN